MSDITLHHGERCLSCKHVVIHDYCRCCGFCVLPFGRDSRAQTTHERVTDLESRMEQAERRVIALRDRILGRGAVVPGWFT